MTDPDREDIDHLERSRMSFGAHLEELRSRLLRAVIATLVAFGAVFAFNREAMVIVVAPYREVMRELNLDPTLNFLGVPQAFFGYLKVSLVGGLLVAAPIWIYQLWAFMSAGLYRRERRVFFRYAPFAFLLLAGGVVFGYLVLLPIGIRYLITFGDPTVVRSAVTLGEYLGLFTILTLLLGIAFQLPLVMVALSRMGIVGIEFFRRRRKWMILGIFIVAAVITPPDAVTQVLVAVPLVVLYELGIFVAWLGMGERRPPLDRAVLWRRARKIAIAALVLVLLWKPIRELQRGYAAEDWVYRGEEEHRPDFRELLAEVLESPVAFGIRVGERGEATLVAARTRQGPVVAEVAPAQRKVTVIDRRTDPRRAVVRFNPSGEPLYEVAIPEEVPFEAFVPGLIAALELLDDEGDRRAVQDLLERFSGRNLGASFDEALAAARAWHAETRAASWKN